MSGKIATRAEYESVPLGSFHIKNGYRIFNPADRRTNCPPIPKGYPQPDLNANDECSYCGQPFDTYYLSDNDHYCPCCLDELSEIEDPDDYEDYE